MSDSSAKRIKSLPIVDPQGSDEQMLLGLQRETFSYFIDRANSENGLVADSSAPNAPCSIAVMGLTLSIYLVSIERKLLTRRDAAERILRILRFFRSSEQSASPTATGYRGFYYHFLDMTTGRRTWESELSTIDTALLMAGVLSVQQYFSDSGAHGNSQKGDREIEDCANVEDSIVELARELFERVDWQWALDGGESITHGWKPESGFIQHRWDQQYSEAMILYMQALGSPTHPIDPAFYKKWTSTFELKNVYGYTYIYAGPLFIHQLSHLWIDFRGLSDDLNRKIGFDYFENSRRATMIHRQYGIENPQKFVHYGEDLWGITACDGPGFVVKKVKGVRREFYDYMARGAPFGPDDGTISPWVAVASLPFAPEIVLDTTRKGIERLGLKNKQQSGLESSFNPTFPVHRRNPHGWVSSWQFGLNQGPIVLMIENFKSDLIWKLMRKNLVIQTGLSRAGFTRSRL